MRSFLYFISFTAIIFNLSLWQTAQGQEIPKNTIIELKERFLFDEVVEIAKKYNTQSELKKYLSGRSDIYQFDGSEKQGEMLVEGYRIQGKPSVVGISFYLFGENHILAMINILIYPKEEKSVKNLITKSFDSIDTLSRGISKGGKLYWLGQYTLNANKSLKISLRSDMMSKTTVYSINYVISNN